MAQIPWRALAQCTPHGRSHALLSTQCPDSRAANPTMKAVRAPMLARSKTRAAAG